jgi:hypothetical protein
MAGSDGFYNEIIAELVPVFTDLGKQYTVKSQGVYDPDTMTTPEGTTRSVWGIVADQQTMLQIVGSTGGTWTATKTLVMRNDAAPLPGESIDIDGDWFPLSNVVPIKPADVTVVYLMDVSK